MSDPNGGATTRLAMLGPAEMRSDDGARIDVASRRHRQLLAALAIDARRSVDIERIVELVWADIRPADPVATIQTNVSRLRRLLVPPLVVETTPSGYLLGVPDGALDIERFERLVNAARDASGEGVIDLAAQAMRLWRGRPFADLDHPEVEPERQPIDERRQELVELQAEALFDLGRFGEAIGLVEPHIAENPYRERPVATLMRSLYAAGRQADALTVCASLRQRLLNDLGIDPSIELRNVEMSILRHDVDYVGAAAEPTDRGWVEVLPASGDSGPDEIPPISQRIRFCTTDDSTRLAYAVSGHGPPLVKAANWMTHLDYDWESLVWRHWNEGLSRRHRLVRYDERGCGLSDHDVETFTFDAWVDDLASVVDAAGLDRFPLLGISQGGAVAVAYAVANPERVSRLVLFGGYPRGRAVRATTEAERREADLHLELARVGWGTGEPTFRQVFTSQFMPDGTQEQWGAFNELQRRTCSPENAVRFMEVFANIAVTELATKVQCPTLILHSRNELRVPFENAIELASLIPDSQLVSLESRNHILLEPEPAWPHFLAEVHSFLAEE